MRLSHFQGAGTLNGRSYQIVLTFNASGISVTRPPWEDRALLHCTTAQLASWKRAVGRVRARSCTGASCAWQSGRIGTYMYLSVALNYLPTPVDGLWIRRMTASHGATAPPRAGLVLSAIEPKVPSAVPDQQDRPGCIVHEVRSTSVVVVV